MLHFLVHNKHWLIILKRINIVCARQSWHTQNDKTAHNPVKTVFGINENKDIFYTFRQEYNNAQTAVHTRAKILL